MRPFIALILTLLLSGCAAAAMVEPLSELPALEPAAEGPVALAAEESFSYIVEHATSTDTATAEDGAVLATYRFDLPQLLAVRADGSVIVAPATEAEEQAVALTAAFNEKFGKWAAAEQFGEIVTWAEEDLAFRREEGMEWPVPYTLELDCAAYQRSQLVSVAGTYYSYTGGAHPNTWMLSWNYDLEAGDFFEIELLGEGTDLRAVVTAEIIRQASVPDEDGFTRLENYWEDYEGIISNWADYSVTFDEAGMTVSFSPYELAAYAAGTQTFTLPYDFLKPHLSPYGQALLGLE